VDADYLPCLFSNKHVKSTCDSACLSRRAERLAEAPGPALALTEFWYHGTAFVDHWTGPDLRCSLGRGR